MGRSCVVVFALSWRTHLHVERERAAAGTGRAHSSAGGGVAAAPVSRDDAVVLCSKRGARYLFIVFGALFVVVRNLNAKFSAPPQYTQCKPFFPRFESSVLCRTPLFYLYVPGFRGDDRDHFRLCGSEERSPSIRPPSLPALNDFAKPPRHQH